MARPLRIDVGGESYHVHNRANGKAVIFHTEADYAAFERILFEKLEETGVLCMAYAIMPNHWHLMVKTYEDGDLARLMRAITQDHTQLHHLKHDSIGTGHLYQGRYKSHLLDTERYFLTVLKYIERNPVRASLCKNARDWKWGSAYHRLLHSRRESILNADLPCDLPKSYEVWLNEPTGNEELDELRRRLLQISSKKLTDDKLNGVRPH